MSKRTPGLPQRPRGFWPTPKAAVAPLIPFLPERASYVEPCAGAGDLVHHLTELWSGGSLLAAYDIEPQEPWIGRADALTLDLQPALFITNVPWPVGGKRGDPALSIIKHLSSLARTWTLLPWDFAANAYFQQVSDCCVSILPIGRVSWLGNGQGGKDNACWACFDASYVGPTKLYARGIL